MAPQTKDLAAISIPNRSYATRFLYAFSGSIPALVSLVMETRGFATFWRAFENNELTNFWSYAVLVLLIAAFIFFLHFIARKTFHEDSMYPAVSAATISSGYGIILSGSGLVG